MAGDILADIGRGSRGQRDRLRVIEPLPQPAAYHAFSDGRSLLGLPNAADVLTSLSFTLVGIAAAARLLVRDRPRFARVTEAGAWCVAIALVLTGFGSIAYHLEPTGATLVLDRLPMTLAFAGALSVALSQRIGPRIAALALPVLALLGLASVAWWHGTGNVTPYAVVQYGSAAALVLLAAATPRGDDPFPWHSVIVLYAIAKLCEAGDAAIHAATQGLVAGHALKHLAAAAAGAAALAPLWRTRRQRRSPSARVA